MRSSDILKTTLLAVLAAGLIGCNSSTAPEPAPKRTTPPPDTDLPTIPEPTGPYAYLPEESGTVTLVKPLTTSFRPTTTRIRGDWKLSERYHALGCTSDWLILEDTPGIWNYEIGDYAINWAGQGPCFAPGSSVVKGDPALNGDFTWKPLLMEDGHLHTPPAGQVFTARQDGTFPGTYYEYKWELAGPELANDVYIRRDRQWQRARISGQSSKIIIGNASEAHTTTYQRGIQRSQSEAFAQSVTAQAGVSWAGLSAGVQGTISKTYGTTVTTEEVRTESETRTLNGTSGKITVFNYWELVETYTICDAEGNPYKDPNYEMKPMTMEARGDLTALVATEFDN